MDRYKTTAAVFALIMNKTHDRILLQKRVHTGTKDGFYDLGTAGHVEDGESMREALSRELKEELGLAVKPESLAFSSITHKRYQDTNTPYFNGYFIVDNYRGEPKILEPHKNAALIWASLDNLPENLIVDRKVAIKNYLEHISYVEDGWH